MKPDGIFAKTAGIFGFRKCRPALLPAALAAGIALNLFLSSLLTLIPLPGAAEYDEASAPLRDAGLLYALRVSLWTPVIEETLFRGLLCGSLSLLIPSWAAIAISSAVFAMLHGTGFWVAFAALCAVPLGIIFVRGRSLYPCILFHTAFNSVNYIWRVIPSPRSDTGLVILCACSGCAFAAAFAFIVILTGTRKKKQNSKEKASV